MSTSPPPSKRTKPMETKINNPPQLDHHQGSSRTDIPSILSLAQQQQFISLNPLLPTATTTKLQSPPQALFIDLQSFQSSLQELHHAFNEECPGITTWTHTFAVKANPVLSLLKLVVENGHGLECASLNEVELSILAGCHPSKIMFDSPCKTMYDLQRALELGVHINMDSFEELQRAQTYLTTLYQSSKSTIGLRINPLLGEGTIQALSVSTSTSKFGIPLTPSNKIRLLHEYKLDTKLTALHAHVGSQGCSLEMLANGAKSLFHLAQEIGFHQIKTIDIGGGLPANFSSEITTPTLREYAQQLTKSVPELFNHGGNHHQINMITEFGRALITKCGWFASRIEYIKETAHENLDIVVIHAGSDMFVRTCYCPEQFPLNVEAYRVIGDDDEQPKITKSFNVVGPLCFGGDVIKRNVLLPSNLQVGDVIVIRDCGANCLSLWSKHCSRSSPPVIGYEKISTAPPVGNGYKLQLMRKEETLEDVLKFWS
jgi:diaminopimelate decarboxylase